MMHNGIAVTVVGLLLQSDAASREHYVVVAGADIEASSLNTDASKASATHPLQDRTEVDASGSRLPGLMGRWSGRIYVDDGHHRVTRPDACYLREADPSAMSGVTQIEHCQKEMGSLGPLA